MTVRTAHKLLEMKGISKSFYGVQVLRQVDFSLDRGEVIAVCGENGAGKSTLMKILTGIYPMDSGTIHFDGEEFKNLSPLQCIERGITMIHQELNLVYDMTVAQNVFLGKEPKNSLGLIDFPGMNKRTAQLMERLKERIDPAAPVRTLKVAQKQVVEIAKAISSECKLMIMDEPTAVLTERETEMLFGLIRNLSGQGIAVVYISHRLKEIRQICGKVAVMRDGALVTTRPVAGITEQEIARLMVGREVTESTAADFCGGEDDVALEVRNVSDGLLKDVSFKVRRGEILGFSGLVGAGRTELMEYIFGLRKASGEIFINGLPVTIRNPSDAIRQGLGFATEDRKFTGMIPMRSISENMNYVYFMKWVKAFISKRQTAENNDGMIRSLNIVCRNSEQLVSNLSGGNQQKIVLGKWLLVNSEILILDEPTRGIDVGAREEIYQIVYDIARGGKAVIVISSDLQEVLKVCQRIIVMYEGRITGELMGNQRTENNIMALAANVA